MRIQLTNDEAVDWCRALPTGSTFIVSWADGWALYTKPTDYTLHSIANREAPDGSKSATYRITIRWRGSTSFTLLDEDTAARLLAVQAIEPDLLNDLVQDLITGGNQHGYQ